MEIIEAASSTPVQLRSSQNRAASSSMIVTGGSGSIGQAVARRFAMPGCEVLLADVAFSAGLPEGCTPMQVDVCNDASVRALLDRALTVGPLHAVVLAHGLLRETPSLSFDEEAVRDVIAVNLEGAARLLARAAPLMAEGGAIVTLSSVTASMGRNQAAAAYQAAKAGIEALTRTYAIALAPRGVRVNCVAPGYLSTPMAGEGAALRARQGGDEAVKAFTPFGRLVTPDEVAQAVAFLCSPAASGISGVVLPVDGAQRAW